MSAGAFGYLLGSFIIAGILPAAFLYYGARNGRGWATAVGAVFLAIAVLGMLGSRSFNIGGLLGLALSVAALTAKKRV